MTSLVAVQPVPSRSAAPAGALLQRKCTSCRDGRPDRCHDCQKEQEGLLQRFSYGRLSDTTEAPPIVHEVLNEPGRPLDAGVRSFMEGRLGHDFSRVRVHNDGRAAASASAVNALAYTVGTNVVFGRGEYSPGTAAGQRMLAHELAHVVQQGSDTISHGKLRIGPVGGHLEQQACLAENLANGRPGRLLTGGSHHSGSLQRLVNPRFVSCNPPTPAIAAVTGADPVGVITAANTRAIELLDGVIDELRGTRNRILGGEEPSFPTISDAVAQALTDRFHIDPSDRRVWTGRGEGSVLVLIRRFQGARQILNDGAMRYQCLGGANVNFTFGNVNCTGSGCDVQTRAVTCAGASNMVLCAPFWSDPADDQAGTLMHESFHIYFDHIGDTGNLANAHCYEQFIYDFHGLTINPLFVGSCP